MNRRGFLTALGALASTVALPSVPSIPIQSLTIDIYKIMCNSMYGKFGNPRFYGGRVLYTDTDGVVFADVSSSYPEAMLKT